jgi:hypothetical protein
MGFMESDSESDVEENGIIPPYAKGEKDVGGGGESLREEEEKVFINEVLSGLSMWMDRVFDGSVKKIRLDYWPEMSQ